MFPTCRVEEQWPQVRVRLRERYPELTEEDLVLVEGREEDLLEAIARRTGGTREAAVDALHAAGMFSPA